MKVPKKQPKRDKLWLNDGTYITLRPEYKNHMWSYGLVSSRTDDGKALTVLNILDEYTWECLDVTVERKITAHHVLRRLEHLFITDGIPEHIYWGNWPEATAKAIQNGLERLGVTTLFMGPGSLRGNGYIQSFNEKLRDEILNREILTTLFEARVLIGYWRNIHNMVSPALRLGIQIADPVGACSRHRIARRKANSEGGTMSGDRPS